MIQWYIHAFIMMIFVYLTNIHNISMQYYKYDVLLFTPAI